MHIKTRVVALRKYPSILLLPILSAVSICVTIGIAISHQSRLSWAVAISLCLLFMNALYRKRLRGAFSTLKNYRAVRRARPRHKRKH